LKEAKGRCALCGVTKDERPLDVDHIIPRSRGGRTVYENLQALCSKCNRSKLNKDETDFRHMIEKDHDDHCPFCGYYIKKDFLIENDHAFVRLDNYPVTKGHSLVIPKRHLADYFAITKTEHDAIHDLIRIRRRQLLEDDSLIGGFNIGVNAGEPAGQSVFHCHFHLIPRRKGDYEDPKGGVRGVIPRRGGQVYFLDMGFLGQALIIWYFLA